MLTSIKLTVPTLAFALISLAASSASAQSLTQPSANGLNSIDALMGALPSAPQPTAAGTFEFFFDGSDVGLTTAPASPESAEGISSPNSRPQGNAIAALPSHKRRVNPQPPLATHLNGLQTSFALQGSDVGTERRRTHRLPGYGKVRFKNRGRTIVVYAPGVP